MLILSVDSSAAPASVCLYEDGKLLADFYLNSGFTHSQTLMAMVESALRISCKSVSDVDAFAVNNGPGSFTGVRIGVSAVKGMAYAADKPCIPVSTLLSMAYNCLSADCVVCACMDARRSQVYNALFRVSSGAVTRLCEDRAISVAELLEELGSYNERILLAGDGAQLVYDSSDNDNISLLPENIRYQRASSAAMAAFDKYNRGEVLSPAALMPSYLRLSQAERERKARTEEKGC